MSRESWQHGAILKATMKDSIVALPKQKQPPLLGSTGDAPEKAMLAVLLFLPEGCHHFDGYFWNQYVDEMR